MTRARADKSGKILVLDFGEPQQRLMTWFLRDSGLDVAHTSDLEDAVDLLRTDPVRAVVVNSREPVAALVDVVRGLRAARTDTRIVVLHCGSHTEDEPELDADVCIHDPDDPDRLVEAIRAAVADQIPDVAEPHDAAHHLE
jgi:DNA-binding response OmpR family regulator